MRFPIPKKIEKKNKNQKHKNLKNKSLQWLQPWRDVKA